MTVGRSASALKLVCNAWVATMNAAVGQSIALARASEAGHGDEDMAAVHLALIPR